MCLNSKVHEILPTRGKARCKRWQIETFAVGDHAADVVVVHGSCHIASLYGKSVPGNKMPHRARGKRRGKLRLATKDGEAVYRDKKCGELGNLEAAPNKMEKKLEEPGAEWPSFTN